MRASPLLVFALAFTTHTALAQTSEKPRELNVAPSAGARTPEATQTPGGTAANICQEIVAFIERQNATGASPGANTANASAAQAAQPGQTAPAVDKQQHASGQSAPIAKNASGASGSAITIQRAQELAQANDVRECQKAAQSMRRAGVKLPEGLIALAALREDLLSAERQ